MGCFGNFQKIDQSKQLFMRQKFAQSFHPVAHKIPYVQTLWAQQILIKRFYDCGQRQRVAD
jgi:uncharacterized protein YutD